MNASALMAAIAEGGANGAALAEMFGVSRTMIWKTMQQLRSEGVQIEGTAGEGYRLLDPAGFGPHTIGWRLGRDVHFFQQCGSTNVQARALAETMENPGGTLVVANQQTAGRGRLGRTWDGEAGLNLMFSLVLEPPVIPQMAPVCVLAWAAAMAEVLECQVKWPNDLITADGHKLGVCMHRHRRCDHCRRVPMHSEQRKGRLTLTSRCTRSWSADRWKNMRPRRSSSR